MICQQRFLPYWAAVARSVKDAKLIRQVAANANGFTGPEPGRSFGVIIQSNKNRPKSNRKRPESHGKPRKSNNQSVKEDARPERPQKSP